MSFSCEALRHKTLALILIKCLYVLLSKRINTYLKDNILSSYLLDFCVHLFMNKNHFPVLKPFRFHIFYPFLSLVLVPILRFSVSIKHHSIIILSSFLKFYLVCRVREGGNTRNKCVRSEACLENSMDQYFNKLVQAEQSTVKWKALIPFREMKAILFCRTHFIGMPNAEI